MIPNTKRHSPIPFVPPPLRSCRGPRAKVPHASPQAIMDIIHRFFMFFGTVHRTNKDKGSHGLALKKQPA